MKARQSYKRTLMCLVAATLAVTLFGLACAPEADPFDVGERKEVREGTPTAQPAGSAGSATAEPTALPEDWPEEFEIKGAMKLAEWDDNGIRLYNYIAGYIISHGYLYDVELVEMPDSAYQEPLRKGEVDVVMAIARLECSDWYKEQTESGAVTDVGSLFEAKPDMRVGVHSNVKERAPEVVEFLAKMVPGDSVLADLTSKMTGGRTGVRPNVAALMFLKNNEDTWTRWVSGVVAERVKEAIEKGKTSLERRKYFDPGTA